jgi:GMP synthase (glutamine-hydrolysing)
MKILVINNYGQYNHRIYRSLQYLKISSEIIPNSTTIEELKEKNPIGIILGGGPSIERAGNSHEYVKEMDCPILGICLGHQIIAQVYGGDIGSAGIESYAKNTINILDENDIFTGLGETMDVWTSHKDEVKTLPPDFKLLATSDVCEIEAMKHTAKLVYGIQFHPEVHHTQNGHIIIKNFYQVCQKYKDKK